MTFDRTSGSAPGIKTTRETIESEVRWAASQPFTNWEDNSNVKIDSTVVDSGNTPTTTIRGGQIMAIANADGNYYTYDADANDGSQDPSGILPRAQDMLDGGVATDTFGPPLVRAGGVKANELIGLDANARTILKGLGVLFDDEHDNPSAPGGAFLPVYYVEDASSDITLTAAMNGQRQLSTDAANAVNYDLPTIAHGLVYELGQTEDQNMVITSAETGNIIAIGNKVADTVTFSTASEKIGSLVRIRAIYTDTSELRWQVENLGGTTATPA